MRYKLDLNRIEAPKSSLALFSHETPLDSKQTVSRKTRPDLELPEIKYKKVSQIFSSTDQQTTNLNMDGSMSLFSLQESTERDYLNSLFKISDFKIDFEKYEMGAEKSHELKRKVLSIKGKYKITDPKFLNLFEKRPIIFMEDGTDLNGFQSKFRSKNAVNVYPDQVKVDINPYIIKYDYDIAAALSSSKAKNKFDCGGKNRKRFTFIAYKELLVELSKLLNGGRKQFHSMFAFSDESLLPSLDSIPKNCKIILLSEEPLPKDLDEEQYEDWLKENKEDGPKSFLTSVPEKKPTFIGLKNNIYDFKSKEDKIACQKGQIEEAILLRKRKFLQVSHKNWRDSTKGTIEDKNHTMDAYLHVAPSDMPQLHYGSVNRDKKNPLKQRSSL